MPVVYNPKETAKYSFPVIKIIPAQYYIMSVMHQEMSD